MAESGARWVRGGAKRCKVGANQCNRPPLPSQGDGLEFKRHFLKIKGKLSDIVSTQKVWLPAT